MLRRSAVPQWMKERDIFVAFIYSYYAYLWRLWDCGSSIWKHILSGRVFWSLATISLNMTHIWLNIPQLTLGNIWVIFPNFQNCMCWKKYMKNNKQNIFHFGPKICIMDSCPWKLSSEFSSNLILFASLNTSWLQKTIELYFCTKWRPLLIK